MAKDMKHELTYSTLVGWYVFNVIWTIFM